MNKHDSMKWPLRAAISLQVIGYVSLVGFVIALATPNVASDFHLSTLMVGTVSLTGGWLACHAIRDNR